MISTASSRIVSLYVCLTWGVGPGCLASWRPRTTGIETAAASTCLRVPGASTSQPGETGLGREYGGASGVNDLHRTGNAVAGGACTGAGGCGAGSADGAHSSVRKPLGPTRRRRLDGAVGSARCAIESGAAPAMVGAFLLHTPNIRRYALHRDHTDRFTHGAQCAAAGADAASPSRTEMTLSSRRAKRHGYRPIQVAPRQQWKHADGAFSSGALPPSVPSLTPRHTLPSSM